MSSLPLALVFAITACVPSQQYEPLHPPPSAPMAPTVAIGQWSSTFGDVSIQPDDSRGGITTGAVRGTWAYEFGAERVVGNFEGTLRGNLLEVSWSEARDLEPEVLRGDAFAVFDGNGREFQGTWWSKDHDRMGGWKGWRGP